MNSAYKLCLVCDQIKTAAVCFQAFSKPYTYLYKDLVLEVGQEVIVETGNDDTLKVAQVVAIHEDAEVDPNFRGTYRWILSNMGTTARAKQTELHDLEKQASAVLRKAEKAKLRKQVRSQLEDVYGEDTLKQLHSITGNGDTPDPLA